MAFELHRQRYVGDKALQEQFVDVVLPEILDPGIKHPITCKETTIPITIGKDGRVTFHLGEMENKYRKIVTSQIKGWDIEGFPEAKEGAEFTFFPTHGEVIEVLGYEGGQDIRSVLIYCTDPEDSA